MAAPLTLTVGRPVAAARAVSTAAPVASVNAFVLLALHDLEGEIVRVGMADAVRTDALHEITVIPEERREAPHGVVARVVDDAGSPLAGVRRMRVAEDLSDPGDEHVASGEDVGALEQHSVRRPLLRCALLAPEEQS